MRRIGNLIDRIAEPDNLRLAYLKARRGKHERPDVRAFARDLDRNLSDLTSELRSGEVRWGGYRSFHIQDPKPRLIQAPAFRARVAHHAILNVCEPVFDACQIPDSFACRKNKGLDGALKRALRFSRPGGWFLKMDIRKCFDTIRHEILRNLLRRRFKDSVVLRLFDGVIDTHETEPGRGIPIGNLTSQFFANHYLGVLDHHAKETLRARRYVRYMDDFVFWDRDRRRVREIRAAAESFLADRLSLAVKPPCLNACRHGLPFLGYKVYPDGLRLARRTRQRFRRRTRAIYRLLDEERLTESEAARRLEPMTAFACRGASLPFRRRVFANLENPLGPRPEARTG